LPIFFDGGIRRGEDALKALAMGADIVFIGRPVLYGLAVGGQAGVELVLKIINNELAQAMITTGCSSIKDC